MKKFLFIFAFVVMAITAEAQLFVAGGLSAHYSGGSSTSTVNSNVSWKGPKTSGFSITPAVGYMIPEKPIGVGLSLGYSYSSVKNYNLQGNLDVKSYVNAFDIAPFFRFVYAKFPSITLYADVKLPIGFAKAKEKNGKFTVDGDKNFVIGARLIPGLTYKFNEHILFTTEIGLLSINYLHTKNTSTSPDGTVVTKSNDFNFGANSRAVASFGFVYLF